MPTIPMPKRPSGFTLGSPTPLVTVDVFMDIQCPHSKQAWGTILELLEHYSGKPLSVTVHLITLSNHRQAWDMSLGLFAVAGGDAQAFFDFATFLFARQNEFYNAPFLHKTHDDLRTLVADCAVEHAGLERAEFVARMDSHEVYIDARTPIRYAANRGVWATPTLFVNNGDDIGLDHTSALEDWALVIDALLPEA